MRQAYKDLEESRRAGYGKKAEDMPAMLSEDSFMSPPCETKRSEGLRKPRNERK